MKQYTKTINGRVEIKPASRIVVKRNGMQIINPSEELLLSDGWVEYIVPTYKPTEEELLLKAKKHIEDQIISYDSSESVNQFYINGLPMWLDKTTRAGLMLRFQSEQAFGKTETTLWYEGNSFVLNLETAMQLLYTLEVYASACYDNTQIHLTNVDNLLTIEDINNYDYTSGYPDKLYFNS